MNKRHRSTTWYDRNDDAIKQAVFNDVTNSICELLKEGHSIGLCKAMTRKRLGYGNKLINEIARSSMEVLSLQQSIKQENISKRS